MDCAVACAFGAPENEDADTMLDAMRESGPEEEGEASAEEESTRRASIGRGAGVFSKRNFWLTTVS